MCFDAEVNNTWDSKLTLATENTGTCNGHLAEHMTSVVGVVSDLNEKILDEAVAEQFSSYEFQPDHWKHNLSQQH